jgi:hemolysin activation/secretion protein
MVPQFRRTALALAVACIPFSAIAQTLPSSDLPGRERELFSQPRAPLSQPGAPSIALPSTTAPAGADKISIVVRGIQIVGATVYSREQLAELDRDLVGHAVPLQAIYDLAQRITSKYGSDGYVLSRAIVPPQNLDPSGSTVRIDVVEGYVDKVEWPAALERYRDFFSDYAAKIIADRPANIRTIERYMLLASDLPGLKFKTTLKASTRNVAASTLIVEVVEKPVDAIGRIDNRGTAARGPTQFLGSATANNLIGAHEAVTFTWAGAVPLQELTYLAGSYRQVLTSEGLNLFANFSDSWGRPGTFSLETLQFRTLGTVFESGLAYPVLRAREENLTLSGLVFASDSNSDMLSAPFNDDRLRGLRFKVDADSADSFGGINQITGVVSQGIDGLGSTGNNNPLASRSSGRVDFSKLEITANRVQPLGNNFSAFVSGYGQYAFMPLLVPEQCGFGGRYYGRAFDPSQILGDSCLETIGELRYDVPQTIPQMSLLQLYGFSDYGNLFTRDASAGTPTTVNAASVGTGVRLGWLRYLNTDLQIAKAVEGPRDDWRVFFAVNARY